MPKSRKEKEEILKKLIDDISKAKALYFVNFQGVNMEEMSELRKRCRENELKFLVAKKTLIALALKNLKIEGLDVKYDLWGNVGIIFGFEDEVRTAKVVYEFSKEIGKLNFLKGILLEKPNYRIVSEGEIINLAKLPSLEEIKGKLIYLIKFPISSFINILNVNLRNFILVINTIKLNKIIK